MISEYLLKGIDNIFSKSLAQPHSKPLSREMIKANLHSVVKQTPKLQKNDSTFEGSTSNNLSKSRLRTILQKNKSAQLKSVIRRQNSRSPSPYQRINTMPNKPDFENEATDKITYYREQRKNIQKSRVLQKSRVGYSNSRIFRVNSSLKLSEGSSKATPSKSPIKASIRF